MTKTFPAIPMCTGHTWDDIRWGVLTKPALQEIRNISSSQPFKNNPRIKGKQLPFRFLFEGDDTDRKWIAAALLGKDAGKAVYRLDLGKSESAYIGETEKNINAVISAADARNSILFFDEADALFGNQATDDQNQTDDGHDSDNLLKLTDSFSGTIIFSFNSDSVLDQSFLRRMHASVLF